MTYLLIRSPPSKRLINRRFPRRRPASQAAFKISTCEAKVRLLARAPNTKPRVNGPCEIAHAGVVENGDRVTAGIRTTGVRTNSPPGSRGGKRQQEEGGC